MPRLLEYLLAPILAPIRRRQSFVRLLRGAEQAGAVNPDRDVPPMLIRGNSVYSIPIAYRINGRAGHETVKMAVHPMTPKSAMIAAALHSVASKLPAHATLRLVAQPVLIEP